MEMFAKNKNLLFIFTWCNFLCVDKIQFVAFYYKYYVIRGSSIDFRSLIVDFWLLTSDCCIQCAHFYVHFKLMWRFFMFLMFRRSGHFSACRTILFSTSPVITVTIGKHLHFPFPFPQRGHSVILFFTCFSIVTIVDCSSIFMVTTLPGGGGGRRRRQCWQLC